VDEAETNKQDSDSLRMFVRNVEEDGGYTNKFWNIV